MKTLLRKMWRQDDGVLSFEWILLLTLLAIGIIGGLCAVRDAIIDELGDVAQAALAIDQSYSFPGFPPLGIPPSVFTEETPVYFDCDRATEPAGQGPLEDQDS